MARLSEQMERYDDMVEYMQRVAKMDKELDFSERALISVAFKSSLVSGREALRHIAAEEAQGLQPHEAEHIALYRQRVEAELDRKLGEIILTLDNFLIPKAVDQEAEALVFFIKMKGDYNRYRTEFKKDDASCAEAEKAYSEALAKAKVGLNAAHPILLGCALNFSVFLKEIQGNSMEAVSLARQTWKDAEPALTSLDPQTAGESSEIVALLVRNLELWQTGVQVGVDGHAAELDGTAVEDL